MNFKLRIQYPKIYKKNVNINELNDEEKSALVFRIFDENLDYNILFEIIKSYPKIVQSSLTESIILKYSVYDKNIELAKNLIRTFYNENYLKKLVFEYNKHPYRLFSDIAFELVFDELTEEEIEFLLRNPYNNKSREQLKILIDKDVDIGYLFEGDKIDELLFGRYLEYNTSEKRIDIILKYRNIDFSQMYNFFNYEELAFLSLVDARFKKYSYFSKDIFKEILLKYNLEIIKRKKEVIVEDGFSISTKDIIEIINELDLSNDVKRELIDVFEIYQNKYEFLSTYSKTEIIQYILNLNSEELSELTNSQNIYFRMSIKDLPKEKQIEIVNINYKLIINVNDDVRNYFLNNKDKNIVTNDMLIALFKIQIITLEELYQKCKFKDEFDYIDFLNKTTMLILPDEYLDVINKVATKLIEFNSDYKMFILKPNLELIINKYPNIIKIMSFDNLRYDELILLHDFCIDDKKYLYYKLNTGVKDKFYEQDLVKYLELATLEELNNSKIYFIRNISDYIISGNISKSLLEKLYCSKNIIKNLNMPTDENITQYINLLNQIDDTGKLKWLFEQINSINFNKTIQKASESNTYYSLLDSRYRFLKNVMIINDNIDIILDLYKTNPNLLFTFNFELLNLLDMEDIIFYSKYNSLNNIEVGELLENKHIIKEYISYLKNHLNNSREEIYNLLCFFSKMDSKSQKEYFEKFDINDTLYFIHEKTFFISKWISVDLLYKIKNNENEKIESINENMTLKEILNIISTNMLGLSYENYLNLILEYFNDLDIILRVNIGASKEDYEYIQRVLLFDRLFLIGDVKKIKEEYSTGYYSLEKMEYIQSIKTKELLRRLFTKEKMEKIYKIQEQDLINKIDGVSIYELPNEFNLLISVVGAYVKDSQLTKNPYEQWNDQAKNVNQNICTSLINQSNLSFARSKDSVMFGFCNIKDDEIVKEAPYDVGSDSNSIKIYTHRPCKCMSTKNLIDNTRFGHNELLLKRNNDVVKRQPDYIIVVDKIKNKDIKTAQEFGVPIVVINTSKIIKYNLQKLTDIIKQLEKNIDMNLLKELIVLYNNNYTGFITLDDGKIKKYYKTLNIEMFLINYVEKIIATGNSELIMQYISILKTEKDKYIYTPKEFFPYNFDMIINILEMYLQNNITDIKKMK